VERVGGEVEGPERAGPGAPKGNTNAVKHGRRCAASADFARLYDTVSRLNPAWLADPGTMPDELQCLFMAIVQRLEVVAAATTPAPRVSEATAEAAATLHARLMTSENAKKNNRTINQLLSPSLLAGRG
jgi:hypothetical protein